MTFNQRIQQQEANLRKNDADLREEAVPRVADDNLQPSTKHNRAERRGGFQFIPLAMGGKGRTHAVSEGSARLINEEVALEDLARMTEAFYDKAFQDETLDKFIRSHDDPHGDRFALWIHQKLSGSKLWDAERRRRCMEPVTVAGGYQHVVHDRTSAHVGAWYSAKRPEEEVGRHFQLDECRVWMRLHFWALRESGLVETSPSFADYYVRFIAHFVRVYESSAPVFARDAWRWSADPKNIEQYIANGRVMKDVLGLTLEEAEAQIPRHEAHDAEWPYNQTPQALAWPYDKLE